MPDATSPALHLMTDRLDERQVGIGKGVFRLYGRVVRGLLFHEQLPIGDQIAADKRLMTFQQLPKRLVERAEIPDIDGRLTHAVNVPRGHRGYNTGQRAPRNCLNICDDRRFTGPGKERAPLMATPRAAARGTKNHTSKRKPRGTGCGVFLSAQDLGLAADRRPGVSPPEKSATPEPSGEEQGCLKRNPHETRRETRRAISRDSRRLVQQRGRE